MGAGVLPIAINKGKIYFLFSREYIKGDADPGLWSDFGGSEEIFENNKETAIRECYEEANGILGSLKKIKELVNNSVISISINKYKTYIVLIDYNKDLPKKFRKKFLTVKKYKPELIYKNGFFEKDMLKWISYEDLKYYKKKHFFRPWYKKFINYILKHF